MYEKHFHLNISNDQILIENRKENSPSYWLVMARASHGWNYHMYLSLDRVCHQGLILVSLCHAGKLLIS